MEWPLLVIADYIIYGQPLFGLAAQHWPGVEWPGWGGEETECPDGRHGPLGGLDAGPRVRGPGPADSQVPGN